MWETERQVERGRGLNSSTGTTRYLPVGNGADAGGACRGSDEGYTVAASLLQWSGSTSSCRRRPANVDVIATGSEAARCFAGAAPRIGPKTVWT